jgi:two-component system, OmpR family, catabolic regulation response regulator CreB
MAQILIVEDEPAIADTLAFALRADGHQTRWQQRATDALQAQRANPADLVILDVGLPDISGFEACKTLRQFSDVPVIFLTARGDEVDRVVGLEIGADDYVVKPFSPREVAARVRTILRRRPDPGRQRDERQRRSGGHRAAAGRLSRSAADPHAA